jgi:outer membrane protein W
MKALFASTALLIFFCLTSFAQTAEKDTTVERLKIRTSFAKSYFGIEAFTTTGGTTQYASQGGLQSVDFSGTVSPRIVLGGTHFWGHADFYVAIPVAKIGKVIPKELSNVSYSEGVETGFRVFPWAIQEGKLRPYIGVSLKGVGFAQVSNDPNKDYKTVPTVAKTIFPYQAGVTYAAKKLLFQAGVSYKVHTNYQYPISRTQYGALNLSPWTFNVGLSYWINTNGGLASKGGERYMKTGISKLNAKNRLNCWYVGIGPSGTFEMTKSEYVKEKYPFLKQSSPGTLIPDIAAGRYFHKLDMNVGLSYRKLSYGSSGYGVTLNYQRRSYTLETYKFLGDYHGFVPYIGPTLAYEDLRFTDTNGSNVKTFEDKKLALGIIFGWDIRISRAETWLLRTNLRYTPNLHLQAEGKKVMFDQMEFNFIQLVWFVGRNKAL